MDELKQQNNEEIKVMKNRMNDIEKSQSHISDTYDEQKDKITELLEDNKKIHKENALLQNTVKNLKEELNSAKNQSNQLGQYIRSLKMVEISGIPRKKGEDCIDLINQLANLAHFSNFDTNQIDITHRTSKYDSAPIIILFITKRDRLNFYSQKKKLYNITSDSFKFSHDDNDESSSTDASPIYMNESLTPENRRLLKEARNASKAKNYKYKGYKLNGVVCVKKSDDSDVIMIKCTEDLNCII